MCDEMVKVDPWLSIAENPPLARVETTYRDAILKNVNRHSEKIAIISDHENISKSFKQLFDDCCNMADNLVQICGLKRGDHVAISTGNIYNFLVSSLACAIEGLIVWYYDSEMTPLELDRYVEVVKPSAIFTLGLDSPQHACFPNMAAIIAKLHGMNVRVIAIDGSPYKMANCYHIKDLLDPKKNDNPKDQLTAPDDPCLVWSSSGSTGEPKMIVWSNRNIFESEKLYGLTLKLDDQDRVCIPMSVSYSYTQLMLRNLLFSSHQVILTGYKYSLKQTISCLVRYECNYVVLVPAMLNDILDQMVKDDLKLKLTDIAIGCATLQKATVARMNAILPDIAVHQVYGLTEVDITSIMTKTRFNTVGKPVRGVKVKIVDDDGQVVPHGEPGQLLVKTDNRMMGYLEPGGAVDDKVFREDGFFETGDLFKMDAQGYLYHQGRAKEVINRGGCKISPKEAEEFFLSVAGVLDCLVLGIPDARLGEEIVAIVYVDSCCCLTGEDMLTLASRYVSKSKLPRAVHISSDGLPRLTSLKHDKQAIRSMMSQLYSQRKDVQRWPSRSHHIFI